LPSQATMPVTLSPSQVPSLHCVPSTYLRQPPLPSQVPSCPQVAGLLAEQTRGSWGLTPGGTKAQSPSDVARSQALQVCPQAEVQQTPSVQNPVWHSASQLQDSAFPLDLLTVPGAHAPGCWASEPRGPSEVLVSLLPPSLWEDPEELQPAAPNTAARARAPAKALQRPNLARHESRIGPPSSLLSVFMHHRPGVIDGL
jgi:hypothetical protein